MKKLFLFIKWILYPGLDISTRKRMKFTKYLRTGDIQTLDAGCGNGAFSLAAASLGNSVLGVDFDADKLRRCEEFRDYLKVPAYKCEFRVWNIYKLEKLDEKFDQIICFETLEHLQDDNKVIAIFSKILNKGGVLHLCTPNADRRPFAGEIISAVEDGGHVRLGYTHEDLKHLLTQNGFKINIEDSAVGTVGKILLNITQYLSTTLTNILPVRITDLINCAILICLYPLTIFDAIIPSKPFNVYVCAEKLN